MADIYTVNVKLSVDNFTLFPRCKTSFSDTILQLHHCGILGVARL